MPPQVLEIDLLCRALINKTNEYKELQNLYQHELETKCKVEDELAKAMENLINVKSDELTIKALNVDNCLKIKQLMLLLKH